MTHPVQPILDGGKANRLIMFKLEKGKSRERGDGLITSLGYPIKWKKIQIIGNNRGLDIRPFWAARQLIG